MSDFIERYTFPIYFLILTTGIFILAHIFTFQIEKKLEIPHPLTTNDVSTDNMGQKVRSKEDYTIILEKNVFHSKKLAELGKSPETISPVPKTNESAPTLPIHLIGTVAGSPRYAYAIIEDPYKKEHKIFRLNDTIAPGIKLVEIHRKKIVILRNGREEEIELKVNKGGRQLRSSTYHRVAPPRPVAATNGVTQVASGSYVVDRKVLETATQDMSRLLTQARLVPNFRGGKPNGFRIFSIVPNSLFDKIGLRNGDIIKSINGIDLKDPEKAFQVYQMLKDNDRFEIDLIRAGQRMTLTYEVR